MAGLVEELEIRLRPLDEAAASRAGAVILDHPVEMQRACPFTMMFAGDNLVPELDGVPWHPGRWAPFAISRDHPLQ